jgi:hypothetical protein
MGYGTLISPMENIPERFKRINVPTLTRGIINAHNTPINDCLYKAKKSLLNNW